MDANLKKWGDLFLAVERLVAIANSAELLKSAPNARLKHCFKQDLFKFASRDECGIAKLAFAIGFDYNLI